MQILYVTKSQVVPLVVILWQHKYLMGINWVTTRQLGNNWVMLRDEHIFKRIYSKLAFSSQYNLVFITVFRGQRYAGDVEQG